MTCKRLGGLLLAAMLLLSGCRVRTPDVRGNGGSLPKTSHSQTLPGNTADGDVSSSSENPAGSQSEAFIVPTLPALPTLPSFPENPASEPELPPIVTDPPAVPAPTLPAVEEPEPSVVGLTPLQPEEYYGRQTLEKAGNRRLLDAYQRITAGCAALQEEISLADLKLTPEETETVFRYIQDDHPLYCWVDSQYTYYTLSNRVTKIVPRYTMSLAEAKGAEAGIAASAAYMLEGLHDGMDEFQRELIIHDRLIRWASYDSSLSAPHTHDLYGVLMNRLAVCDGYAKAFQYLLSQAGIQSLMARGWADGGGHAWNVVRINGAYYHTDITWDDPLGMGDPFYVSYGYFNITAREMEQDHLIDSDSYPLPPCTATADNYFLRLGYTADSLDADQFAAAVAKQIQDGGTGWFAIRYTGGYLLESVLSEFLDWNAAAIRDSAALRSGSFLPPLSQYALNGSIVELYFG